MDIAVIKIDKKLLKKRGIFMYNNGDLDSLTEKEIMDLYASILKNLNYREVIRTYNSPVGDYGEWLFASAYKFKLEPNSQQGYDVIDETNNIKYQVKSRWFNPVRKNRTLNVIRNYENKEFDYLIVIFFNENFKVKEAYKIPHEVVGDYGKYSKHQNGYIVTVNKKVINDERVDNITINFSNQ